MKSAPRVSVEALILLGFAVAFLLAHFSFPPYPSGPVRIERAESQVVGTDQRLGVVVQETGLRHER